MRRYTPLILFTLLGSCSDVVTKVELAAKASEHAAFTFPDKTYYIGSGDGYDCFVIRRGLGNSMRRYRILKAENTVTNRFNVSEDETRWRSYGSKDFGIIDTRRSGVR